VIDSARRGHPSLHWSCWLNAHGHPWLESWRVKPICAHVKSTYTACHITRGCCNQACLKDVALGVCGLLLRYVLSFNMFTAAPA
jgi:hypothetical protein